MGRRGDYYTSVSVGRTFGELLGFQFAEWLEELSPTEKQAHMSISGTKAPAQIVEAGAHDGRLAGDILRWLRERRPVLFDRLEYWIVEPSPRRRERQRNLLAEFENKIRWASDLAALETALSPSASEHPPSHASRLTPHDPRLTRLRSATARQARLPRPSAAKAGHASPIHGIIFANELLDAMPVHRFGWGAARRKWFEWGVGFRNKEFVWQRMPEEADPPWQLNSLLPAGQGTGPLFLEFPTELLALLPDGFILEMCPEAEAWWRQAARLLSRGKLLTLDYGTAETIRPERTAGTLRAYHRHHLTHEVLARPGEQDITAHVNFQVLIEAGAAEGLRAEAFLSQEQFLTRIAARAWGREVAAGQKPPHHGRQFQTLTHPDLLGGAFRVLVQARGA